MNKQFPLLLVCLLSIFSACTAQEAHDEKVLETILFGSCSRENREQELWPAVLNHQPDLWIWLGDNVYGDTQDMAVLKDKYDLQKSNADYQKLLATTPIIGTWDDHDYGVNDGDKTFPKKKESRDLLFDFLDVPKSNPAWNREGAYQSYVYGTGNKKVKILLLDLRYFRDTLERNPSRNPRYKISENGDTMGEAQWEWLEKELTHSDAAIHIIAGGIQLLSNEQIFEKWGNFPKARQRFFDLIRKTQPANAFYLSGDRHIGEVSKIELEGYGPFYDFTSSGLTHSWGSGTEPNQHRVGNLVVDKNFGVIRIDWSQDSPKVTFEIKGKEGQLLDGPHLAMGAN